MSVHDARELVMDSIAVWMNQPVRTAAEARQSDALSNETVAAIDHLITEVRAEMPCYTINHRGSDEPCIWNSFDGSAGLPPWTSACPSCEARAELAGHALRAVVGDENTNRGIALDPTELAKVPD